MAIDLASDLRAQLESGLTLPASWYSDPAVLRLGVYATEVGNKIAIAGISDRGPAKSADLKPGDIVVQVGGADVRSLAGFFRKVWSLGAAGVDVPLVVNRKGRNIEVSVQSGDRRKFLKGPVLH